MNDGTRVRVIRDVFDHASFQEASAIVTWISFVPEQTGFTTDPFPSDTDRELH